MVPMADMLNAAYERDNARLFGDDDDDAGEAEGEVLDKLGEGYTMISTKSIKKGEQIVSLLSPHLAPSSSKHRYKRGLSKLTDNAVQYVRFTTQFGTITEIRSCRPIPPARRGSFPTPIRGGR